MWQKRTVHFSTPRLKASLWIIAPLVIDFILGLGSTYRQDLNVLLCCRHFQKLGEGMRQHHKERRLDCKSATILTLFPERSTKFS